MREICLPVYVQMESGDWRRKILDLSVVYRSYLETGSQVPPSDRILWELSLSILYLARLGKIDIMNFDVTDYGCGYSLEVNIVAAALAEVALKIRKKLRKKESLSEIMTQVVKPALDKAKADRGNHLPPRIERYSGALVQRYDISVQQYNHYPERITDVVFCNGVLECIPKQYITSLSVKMQMTGTYVFANFYRRDVLHDVPVRSWEVLHGSVPVEEPSGDGLILNKITGIEEKYIFPFYLSTFKVEEWKKMLEGNWHFLPSEAFQFSAANFECRGLNEIK